MRISSSPGGDHVTRNLTSSSASTHGGRRKALADEATNSYRKINLDALLAALGGFDDTPAVAMHAGRPTWREQRARFAALWESGKSVEEIANRLERSVASVYSMRCRLNLPPRCPQRRNNRVLV